MDKILRKEAVLRKLLEDGRRVKKASELLAMMKAHREYNKNKKSLTPSSPSPSPSNSDENLRALQSPNVDDLMRSFQDSRRSRQNKDNGLNRLNRTSSSSLSDEVSPNKSQADVVQKVLSWTNKSQAYIVKTALTAENSRLITRATPEQLSWENIESAKSTKPKSMPEKFMNSKTFTTGKIRVTRKTTRNRKKKTNTTLGPTISDLESLNKLTEENKKKLELVKWKLNAMKPINPPSRPMATADFTKPTRERNTVSRSRLNSKPPWDTNREPILPTKPIYLSQQNKEKCDAAVAKANLERISRHRKRDQTREFDNSIPNEIPNQVLLTLKPPPLSPKPSIGIQTSENTIAWFKLNPYKSSFERLVTPQARNRRPTVTEAIKNSERIRLGLQGNGKATTKRVKGVLNIPREAQGVSSTEVKPLQVAPKSGIFRTLFRRSGPTSNSETKVKKGIFQRFWQGMKRFLWNDNRVSPTQNN